MGLILGILGRGGFKIIYDFGANRLKAVFLFLPGSLLVLSSVPSLPPSFLHSNLGLAILPLRSGKSYQCSAVQSSEKEKLVYQPARVIRTHLASKQSFVKAQISQVFRGLKIILLAIHTLTRGSYLRVHKPRLAIGDVIMLLHTIFLL